MIDINYALSIFNVLQHCIRLLWSYSKITSLQACKKWAIVISVTHYASLDFSTFLVCIFLYLVQMNQSRGPDPLPVRYAREGSGDLGAIFV